MKPVYVSIDIESSGPIPGSFSMLSLGAVAFTEDGEVGTFYEKLLPSDSRKGGHIWDDDTLRWWSQFPVNLKEALENPQLARAVMSRFVTWCKDLSDKSKVTLVASPAGFDGMFVNWYAVECGRFRFEDLPWKHRVLDLRSFAAGKLDLPYHDAHNSTIRKIIGFEPSVAHDHNALNDAREQGETFMALLRWKP